MYIFIHIHVYIYIFLISPVKNTSAARYANFFSMPKASIKFPMPVMSPNKATAEEASGPPPHDPEQPQNHPMQFHDHQSNTTITAVLFV